MVALNPSTPHIKIPYVVIRHKLNKEIEQEFLSSKKDSNDPLISYLAKDLLTSPLFKEK